MTTEVITGTQTVVIDRVPQQKLILPEKTIEIVTAAKQGPEGAKGDKGDPGAAFIFIQSSAAAEWVINHNLNFYPAITLFSVGGAEIEGEVVNISTTQARIYFSTAIAGTARCN